VVGSVAETEIVADPTKPTRGGLPFQLVELTNVLEREYALILTGPEMAMGGFATAWNFSLHVPELEGMSNLKSMFLFPLEFFQRVTSLEEP